jgi:histidinol-phosphate aminotransferase
MPSPGPVADDPGRRPTLADLVPSHVRDFDPYVPSLPDDVLIARHGLERLHRLNNNENPLGPSPRARRALEEALTRHSHHYPSGDGHHLRQALGRRHGLDPEQFIIGNGANEVISCITRTFCREGDNIITAERTFAVYQWVATVAGVEARRAPMREHGFDEAGLLARIDPRSKLIFLCNPNNPTGTLWSRPRLEAFLEAVAGRCLVVLDEAYHEFVEPGIAPDGLGLLARHPHLIVLRTFSKAFALAGLRIGYLAASPQLVALIRKACIVYSVNGPAQLAAEASLADAEEFLERSRAHTRAMRQLFTTGLARLGLPYLAGEGNFVMVRLPMDDEQAGRRLLAQGILVRTLSAFGYPGWIRVSLGEAAAMAACLEALAALGPA